MMLITDARLAAILGAITADAAALGLHWLYDANRLEALKTAGPLAFREPDAANYAGVPGYFAHAGKQAGDNSFYGETCRLVLGHLARHGRFDRRAYQKEWLAHFGPGGTYVGYADRPTRLLAIRLLGCTTPDDYPAISGAEDDQLPALECIPALVACHRGSRGELIDTVLQAVAVTHDHPLAREAATTAVSTLADVLDGVPLPEALASAATFSGATLQPLLTEALALPHLDVMTAAARFGMPCHLHQGLPIIFHIARHAANYRAAVEANILAGGDSCGRSLLLGALMAAHDSLRGGASHTAQDLGIPLHWLTRVNGMASSVHDAEMALTRIC
jgi:hypothetical protein